MKKFLLAFSLLLGACAPQIKEVRVEVVKPCLTQAPPKPARFKAYQEPTPIKGEDANGNPIVGVASIVSMDSFIAFGEYITNAEAWMKDAYARCAVAPAK